MMSLKEALAEWTDWDMAAYRAGVALGLIDPQRSSFATDAKHVFWTDHPVGHALLGLLDALSGAGVLLKRVEPDAAYRYNPDYRGSWEPK